MRTTLDIADDVLIAAKEAARRQELSVGEVISDLARRSLVQPGNAAARGTAAPRGRLTRLGIQALAQTRRRGQQSNHQSTARRWHLLRRHARCWMSTC